MRLGVSKNALGTSELVKLKGQDWLEKQRVAGKIAAGALVMLQEQVAQKTELSLLELNRMAEEYIEQRGAK